MYWLDCEPSQLPGSDRLPLEVLPGLVERDFEYRLSWDAERGMWRLDKRRGSSTPGN